jgi:hypothetical protein
MKSLITLITLGVDDLERSLKFYRKLGLRSEGIVGKEFAHGAVAFFDLQPGLKLAIWPRTSLSQDSGLAVNQPCPTDMCLAHNVRSKEEVDAVLAEALAAGATLVKPAHKTFFAGYSCYFQDPDQHLWEVTWNPQIMPAE